MNHLSDTPPDGDFARYVERLTASNLAGIRQDMLVSPTATGVPARADAARPSEKTPGPQAPVQLRAAPTLTAASLGAHVKWAIGLWIGSQLLGRLFPGAGFLFIPALLAYAGWAFYKANQDSSGGLIYRLQALAATAAKSASDAADEARKAHAARSGQSSRKP